VNVIVIVVHFISYAALYPYSLLVVVLVLVEQSRVGLYTHVVEQA